MKASTTGKTNFCDAGSAEGLFEIKKSVDRRCMNQRERTASEGRPYMSEGKMAA